MNRVCFIKIIKNYERLFHLWFATLKNKRGEDPLRCGQLPLLCRRNGLSKQRQTHNGRKSLTFVWQNVLRWLCGTFINPTYPTRLSAFLLKLYIIENRHYSMLILFYSHRYCHDEIIPHSTVEAPLQNRGKICQLFPNCSCTAILSLAKYSSIEVPSLRIMQDHPHPPASQSR